ncbi:MAG: hypothetical protein IPF90_00385 [Actinomycetales bacterium]|nr:hypothetical protein [Candidatus Phosphoribacter baldrii]
MSQPPSPVSPPIRQVIPAPTGPNWQLVFHSVILLAGAGALLAHLARLQMNLSLTIAWPTVFVVGGIALVLVGQFGLLRRRRQSRER